MIKNRFSSESNNNHELIFQYEYGIFAPGEVTDDSEMAMSAAFAYMDIINENPKKIAINNTVVVKNL